MQIAPKRTTPRPMAAAGRTSGPGIQALRKQGPEHLTAPQPSQLGLALPKLALKHRTLLEDLKAALGWTLRWFRLPAMPSRAA